MCSYSLCRISPFHKFSQQKNLLKTATLDQVTRRLLETKYAWIVIVATNWASRFRSLHKIACLVSLIASKNGSLDLDIKIALELLLAFSYYLQVKGISLDCDDCSIYKLFGRLLCLFAELWQFSMLHYGFVLNNFQRCLPALHFPVEIH